MVRLFAIVGSIDEILLAMAVAVLVSAGIGILLSLYNSMEMRRRQVAVLRVLGTSAARIFGMVLAEAALIGILQSLMTKTLFDEITQTSTATVASRSSTTAERPAWTTAAGTS